MGDGVRKTLSILNEYVCESNSTIIVHEIPSGTKIYDWIVPKEWICKAAYIDSLSES